MSRPRAWNGTGWVDPAFHVGGGVYKSYIAPTYEPLAIADQHFTTDVQGWTARQNGSTPVVQDGSLYLRAAPDSVFDWSAWDSLTQDSGSVRGNAAECYVTANVRAVNHGIAAPVDVEFRCWYVTGVSVAMSLDFTVGPGQDTGYIVRTSQVRTVETNNNLRWDVVGRFYPDVEIWIDYARIIEVSTGRVLESLGDPGWEPKVYRGNGVWK